MIQLDLHGTPVTPAGRKDPDAPRQYLFRAKTIVAVNSIALKTGQSKEEIVNDAIITYAAAMSLLPELVDIIRRGDISDLLGIYIKP